MFHAILIPGHGDKGTHYDPGATIDLDHDGDREGEETEAWLARSYARHTAEGLQAAGWEASIFAVGRYSERARAAREVAQDVDRRGGQTVIVYAHVDSYPGPAHSLVGHLDESRRGYLVARAVADALPRHLDWRARVRGYGPDEAERWARNGRAVLYPSLHTPSSCAGILVEPWPIQVIATLDDDGRSRLVAATAAGLIAGLQSWAVAHM